MKPGDESEVRQVEEAPHWHPPVLGDLRKEMQTARCGNDEKESFLFQRGEKEKTEECAELTVVEELQLLRGKNI